MRFKGGGGYYVNTILQSKHNDQTICFCYDLGGMDIGGVTSPV